MTNSETLAELNRRDLQPVSWRTNENGKTFRHYSQSVMNQAWTLKSSAAANARLIADRERQANEDRLADELRRARVAAEEKGAAAAAAYQRYHELRRQQAA
jgi:hypothetical protein